MLLALLKFCAYYARFYATPQSIMLVIIQFNITYVSHAGNCYNQLIILVMPNITTIKELYYS